MKLLKSFFVFALLFALTACNTTRYEEPTDPNVNQQITTFEECVAAGNLVMESYPRKCQYGQMVFTEEVEPTPVDPCDEVGTPKAGCPDPNDKPCAAGSQEPGCPPPSFGSTTESSNEEKMCTREFKPVCGDIQVQCITTPCDPIRTTFENLCEAEKAGAINITEGACVDAEPNPEGACLSFDGNWIEEAKECEGMGQEQCENLGGTYNECASACRNDPNAEMCTMQCVQVCQF